MERVKFVQAVNCLMTAPPKFKKNFPIVENRYDDFVALHVNTTLGGKGVRAMNLPLNNNNRYLRN
jgi:hypothetical protein